MSDDEPANLGDRRTDVPDFNQLADYLVRDLSDPATHDDGQAYLDALGNLHDGLTSDDLRQLCIVLGQRLARTAP